MAISFNTGTTADSGGSQTTSQAITVPAGVLAGDVVLILAQQVPLTSTPSTFTASSTGTTPTSAGSPVTGTEPLPAAVTGQVFYFVASASDAGKVVTITASATGFWAVALVAYTGASNTAPIDVISGAFGGANSGSVTCPTVSTVTAGDWAVFLGGGAGENASALTPPSGSTTRESDVSSSQIDAVISDSNGSVGAAGTNIGGGTFTSPTSTNSILTAFTVGLAPPSAPKGGSEAQPPAVPPGLWTTPGAVFPQPFAGDPGIPPYYGIPQFIRPAGQVPRLSLRRSQGRFLMQAWGQGNRGQAWPSWIRQPLTAASRGMRLLLSRGRRYDPGWGQGNQGTQFPLWTQQPQRRRLSLRRSQGQFFPVVPPVALQPPAFTSGGEAPVQIAPPFTSPGSFYQPWQPPLADPSFSPAPPAAPAAPPSYTARQARPVPARQPRGRFAVPGQFSLTANPSLPQFAVRQQRPVPARAPRGRFFAPGQWNLAANPSLPSFLRQAAGRRLSLRRSQGRFLMQAWGQGNRGQAWPSWIRQAGTRARYPRVISSHGRRYDPPWPQAAIPGARLDPYRLGGKITPDLMAGKITPDQMAGIISASNYAGTIT